MLISVKEVEKFHSLFYCLRTAKRGISSMLALECINKPFVAGAFVKELLNVFDICFTHPRFQRRRICT